MANGLVRELQEVKRAAPADLPARDVRARKPLLLRLEAGRALLRGAVLVTLDLAGVFLAIWTALELKAALRGKSDFVLTYHQAVGRRAARLPRHAAAVRALGPLPRPRASARASRA